MRCYYYLKYSLYDGRHKEKIHTNPYICTVSCDIDRLRCLRVVGVKTRRYTGPRSSIIPVDVSNECVLQNIRVIRRFLSASAAVGVEDAITGWVKVRGDDAVRTLCSTPRGKAERQRSWPARAGCRVHAGCLDFAGQGNGVLVHPSCRAGKESIYLARRYKNKDEFVERYKSRLNILQRFLTSGYSMHCQQTHLRHYKTTGLYDKYKLTLVLIYCCCWSTFFSLSLCNAFSYPLIIN